MPGCEIIDRDARVTFVRSAKAPIKKCRWCPRISTRLCDFVISPTEQITHKRTCDAPMCEDHAKRVGPNVDYCPDHAQETK